MPVLSAHCFANHKGGVGKTTLCYQIAAQYAAVHPEKKVLVADFTGSADISEFLLGGAHEGKGRKALTAIVPLSNTTNFCLKALTAASALLADARLVQGGPKREREEGGSVCEVSIFDRVFALMPAGKRAKLAAESGEQDRQFQAEGALDLSDFAVPVCEVNPGVGSNLYLCPSGAELEPPIHFSRSQQQRIISVLRNCFKCAHGDWKVFIDTDGGACDGGSEVYSEIGLSISDFCLLPLHADISEWLRASKTFGVIRDLREKGVSECTVQMVLWNKISVRNSRESLFLDFHRCSFTPTKLEQNMLRTLCDLLHELAAQHPSDFFNFDAENPRAPCFKPAACMRHLTLVGLASRDAGVPIASIHAGIFHGVHMTYNLSHDSVERCRDNLRIIVEAIDTGDELLKSREKAAGTQTGAIVHAESSVRIRVDVAPAGKVEVQEEHVEMEEMKSSVVKGKDEVESSGGTEVCFPGKVEALEKGPQAAAAAAGQGAPEGIADKSPNGEVPTNHAAVTVTTTKRAVVCFPGKVEALEKGPQAAAAGQGAPEGIADKSPNGEVPTNHAAVTVTTTKRAVCRAWRFHTL